MFVVVLDKYDLNMDTTEDVIPDPIEDGSVLGGDEEDGGEGEAEHDAVSVRKGSALLKSTAAGAAPRPGTASGRVVVFCMRSAQSSGVIGAGAC